MIRLAHLNCFSMKNPVLLAILSMVGTIVGAGVFGLPYVFAEAGTVLALVYSVILGLAAVCIHLLYAKIAIMTPGKHRLVGYVQKHLGRREADVVSVTNPMNMLGSLLAYLILGGSFLSVIFGGSTTVWGLIFFGLFAILIIFPFHRVEYVESILTWLLIAIAILIVVLVSPHVKLENFGVANMSKWFLPYGVIFFSFGGLSVVPDIVESLKKNMRRVGIAIIAGTVVSIVLSVAFGAVVAGATGGATTQDAIGGLVPVVGRSIVALGAIFGLLAVATSFVSIGENLKEQFVLDFKFSKLAAWSATIGIPLVAFIFGARDLINVLGFVGSVFGVIDGMIIALMARRVVKGPLRAFAIPLIVVFAVGLISEIFIIFK